MKVLLAPHEFTIGGSPLAAIEHARGLRARGHDVVLLAPPGPLRARCRAEGLRMVDAAPPPIRVVSWPHARRLLEVARAERADLVHAFEPTGMAAAVLGPGRAGIPVLSSLLGQNVPRPLPRWTALEVGGRPALAERMGGGRPGPVGSVPPPVDTDHDHPDNDGTPFRSALGLSDRTAVLLIVSRLAEPALSRGIEASIDAVAHLSRPDDVRLVIVGDGPSRPALEARARQAGAAGAARIDFLGELEDPRSAFAGADVVLGRGTAVLRGMAHAKPALVLGAHGAAEVVDATTIGHFRRHGFVAVPGGADPEALARRLGNVLHDPALAARLGAFARQAVVELRSPASTTTALEGVYEQVVGRALPLRHRIEDVLTVRWWEDVRPRGARLWSRHRRRRRSGGG